MCLTIPYKIILLKSKKALVDYFGKRKEVNLGLTNVKAGDFVILQNNTIVKKVPKNEAEKILKLFKNENRKISRKK